MISINILIRVQNLIRLQLSTITLSSILEHSSRSFDTIIWVYYIIMEVEEGNEYLQSSSSLNKQTLKSLIAQILLSNSAYDCMPINSAMCSIDKTVSLINAINIFINQGVDQLLVWDEDQSKWAWMLTVADIIRFISHALRCTTKGHPITFENFQVGREEQIPQIDKATLEKMIGELSNKSLSHILKQFHRIEPGRGKYIRLKTVVKQSKLSYIVLTMITQKIHRIIIEDVESRMIISIINFKDILLFLLRIANEASIEVYSRVPVKSFLQNNLLKDKFIYKDQKLIQAFRLMSETYKSLWINVVDRNMGFCGMIFRRDFKDLVKGWNLHWLWMTVGEFLNLKAQKDNSRIPQFRFFDPEDTTKDILWKIVMCSRNVIVCLDKQTNRVLATIGLMELFNLYVQCS